MISEHRPDAGEDMRAVALSLGIHDVTVDVLTGGESSPSRAPLVGSRRWTRRSDIATLLLNEWQPVEIPGASVALLARTGTTAEYGYVVVANVARECSWTFSARLPRSGCIRRPRGSPPRADRGEPSGGARPVRRHHRAEAGAGWAAVVGREDPYRGAGHAVPPETPTRCRSSDRSLERGKRGRGRRGDGGSHPSLRGRYRRRGRLCPRPARYPLRRPRAGADRRRSDDPKQCRGRRSSPSPGPRPSDDRLRRRRHPGVGLLAAVGLDAQRSWAAITAGSSGISRVTTVDADGFISQLAGELPGVPTGRPLCRAERAGVGSTDAMPWRLMRPRRPSPVPVSRRPTMHRSAWASRSVHRWVAHAR